MRYIYLLVLSILLSCNAGVVSAQESKPYGSIPFWKTWSVKSLSHALTKDSVNQYQSAYNIYYWITHHIRYDIRRYRRLKWKEISAQQTLCRRKSLCGGYANLFQALCKEAGIKAWVVDGYDKGGRYRSGQRFYMQEHAWNVFYIDSTYYLTDPTWGSGGMRIKKQRLLKAVCHVLHIPFITRKAVFKRKPDDRFFASDTSSFLKLHLPVVPMWQLKHYPMGIDCFEKGVFAIDSSSIHFFHFESEIAAYNELTEDNRWLYKARKGNAFNTHNNRVKGYNYYYYLRYFAKTYELTKASTDRGKKRIASAYADTAIVYTKKFLRDNDARHTYVLDSITDRNKVITSFGIALINEDIKNSFPVSSQIKQCKFQIKNERVQISNKNKLFAKSTSDNLDNLVSVINSKNADTLAKRVKAMNEIYTVNSRMIDSLNMLLPVWYDSVSYKIQELTNVYDSIVSIYAQCGKFIKRNTQLNADFNPLWMIQNNQTEIRMRRDLIRKLYARNTAIQAYIYTNLFAKHIDPINSKCIQLQKRNKALLKNMSKWSIDSEERRLYTEENNKMYMQLEKTTGRSTVKITLLEMRMEWLKRYKYILKKELKKLYIEQQYENQCNKLSTKSERLRNDFYQRNANNVVNSSQNYKLRMK